MEMMGFFYFELRRESVSCGEKEREVKGEREREREIEREGQRELWGALMEVR